MKSNPKVLDRELATKRIELLFERAVGRFDLEVKPHERDALLATTMTAYKQFR